MARGSDFIGVLRRTAPSKEELGKLGLDSAGAERVLDMYRARDRSSVTGGVFGSELERMISEHDCSTVELGPVRFLAGPKRHVSGVQVGVIEADPLVVERDGQVSGFDFAAPDFRMFKCGVDSERFLDGLAELLKIGQEARDRKTWKGRGDEAAHQCAQKAGGEEYFHFYRVLCSHLAR